MEEDHFRVFCKYKELVRSVRLLDLRYMQEYQPFHETPYAYMLFPQLRSLDVTYEVGDWLLDRFLPSSLVKLDLTIEPPQGKDAVLSLLVAAAPSLPNLKMFFLDRRYPRTSSGINVPELQAFLSGLPARQNLTELWIKNCNLTAECLRMVSELPNLVDLSLDTRFLQDLPLIRPSTVMTAVQGMETAGLKDLELSVGSSSTFDMAPLLRFPLLVNLTILVYGNQKPIKLDVLEQLIHLKTALIDIPNMGSLLTNEIFTTFLQAWQDLRILRLIDSGRDMPGFNPDSPVLPLRALGKVSTCWKKLHRLEVAVNPRGSEVPPGVHRSLPWGTNVRIHWSGPATTEEGHVDIEYLVHVCRMMGRLLKSPYGTQFFVRSVPDDPTSFSIDS